MLKPKDLLDSLEKVGYSDEMLEPVEIRLGSRVNYALISAGETFRQALLRQQMAQTQNHGSIGNAFAQQNVANDLNQYQYASSVTLPNMGLTYGGNTWRP